MHRLAHISSKNIDFFPMLSSGNENSERESNPIPLLVYLHLSRSAFLVSFIDPNKQLPNVKSVFKILNYGFRFWEIYRFITFLRIENIIFY